MNYLVFVDTRAGELEKILSGVKTMLVQELDPARTATLPVNPGDGLYFLRDNGERTVRVQANVVRVLSRMDGPDQGLSHTLKEFQPKLQLTEDQYNYWSAKHRVLLVEFESARKIGGIHVASRRITDRSSWLAFEASDLVAEGKGGQEHRPAGQN